MADDPAFDDTAVELPPGRDEPPIGRTVATPGRLLREARERAGLHVGVLASTLKVSPRKLDALEGDRYDELPDATFARALALSVCRALRCDPAPVLEAFAAADLPSDPLRGAGRGLNAPIRRGAGAVTLRGHSRSAPRARWWVAIVVVIALAGLALAWWSPSWTLAGGPDAQGVTGTVSQVVPEPAAQGVVAAAATGSAPPADGPGATDVALVDVTSGHRGPGGAAVEAMAAPSPAPDKAVAGASTGAADAASGAPEAPRLAITAARDSWVEVSEASGRVVWARVLAAGQTLKPEVAPPLRLVIGNARATQVVFDGRELDLAPVSRGNVARIDIP